LAEIISTGEHCAAFLSSCLHHYFNPRKMSDACMAPLNMFKILPPNAYVRQLGKPTKGKLASLNFSDSGEVCPGMPDFCGAKILDVVHLISCWRSPGVTTLFLQFGKTTSKKSICR
jgi:hypothetical protein